MSRDSLSSRLPRISLVVLRYFYNALYLGDFNILSWRLVASIVPILREGILVPFPTPHLAIALRWVPRFWLLLLLPARYYCVRCLSKKSSALGIWGLWRRVYVGGRKRTHFWWKKHSGKCRGSWLRSTLHGRKVIVFHDYELRVPIVVEPYWRLWNNVPSRVSQSEMKGGGFMICQDLWQWLD